MILTWKSIDKSITNQNLLKILLFTLSIQRKMKKKEISRKEAYLSPSNKDKRIPPSNDTEKKNRKVAQFIEHVLLYALKIIST